MLENKEIFNTLNTICIILDSSNQIIFANDYFLNYLSKNKEDIIGLNFTELVSTYREFKSVKPACNISNTVESFETKIKKHDGSLSWILWNGTCDKNTGNIILTGSDITDYKLNIENKGFKSLFFDNITDGVIIVDKKGTIVDWNNACEKMFGYTRSEALGKSPVDLIFPKDFDKAGLQKEIEKAISENGFWIDDFIYRKSNKEFGIASTKVFHLFRKDVFVGYVSLYHDITEEKRKEKELSETINKYRLFFESTNDAIFVFPIDNNKIPSNFTEVNQKACKMLGYTREELLNLSTGDVFLEIEKDPMYNPSVNYIEGYSVFTRTLVSKNNKHIPAELSTNSFDFKNQNMVLAIVRDIAERISKEKELNTSRERLELALQGSDLSLWDYSVDDDIFFYDRVFLGMIGFEKREINPNIQFLENRIHPDFLPLMRKRFNAHLNGQTPYFEAEIKFLCKTGIWKWVLLRGKVVEYDNNGLPKRMSGTFLDVDDRRRAYRALMDSEKKYRLLFNSFTDAIFIIELDGEGYLDKFSQFNDFACKLTGYSYDELITLDPYLLTRKEEDKHINTYPVHSISDTGMYAQRDIYKKYGEIVPVEINATLFEYESKNMILVHMRDITKKKKNEEEILRLSSAVEQMANGIFILDRNANIIYINGAINYLTGYSKEELSKMSFKDIYRSLSLDFLDGIRDDIKRKSIDFEAVRKNGSKYWARADFSPFSDNTNEFKGYVVILEDVSLSKKLEIEREKLIKELEATNDDLKRLSRMKDDFLAVASHDLRAPFGAILGLSQILLDEETLAREHKENIELIKDSAEIQLKYVNDILDIMQLESGKLDIVKQETNLTEVIQRAINNHIVLANKKNIKVEIVNDFKETVFIDFSKIIQVLNNFLSNSIKFTPSGGKIVIKSYKNRQNEIEVHIIDNGIGINEESLPGLFNLYKQVHKAGTEGEKGSGLGLAICKNLVELHGGSVGVKSKSGAGSDFFFILPVK
jgi:PAS domain S-box-containing protein